MNSRNYVYIYYNCFTVSYLVEFEPALINVLNLMSLPTLPCYLQCTVNAYKKYVPICILLDSGVESRQRCHGEMMRHGRIDKAS